MMRKTNLLRTIAFALSVSFLLSNSIVANTPIEEFNNISSLSIFDRLQQEEVRDVTIILPLDSLINNKNTDKSFDGNFKYLARTGEAYSKDISLEARGKSRRKHCSFPPLRISFSKDNLKDNGLRKKHRSLKLVTFCNPTNNADDNVLKEYLTYKIYNELTNNSLKVQLLKIVFEDTDSKKTLEYYGFLLEDIDALAEQLAGEESNDYGKNISEFETTNANIVSVFQFMIGNEDWSVPHRRNIRYIQLKADKQFLLIPYDFDMSGLIAIEYAKPNVNLGMQSVQQRLFMGKFKNKKSRTKTLDHFRSKRENINNIISECDLLSKAQQIHMQDYIDSFFRIINNPKLLNRAIPYGRKAPKLTELDGTMVM